MYEPLTKANQKEELKTGRRLKKEIKPSQTVFHQMKFMPDAELNYREKQNVPYRQQRLGDFRRDSSKGTEGTGGSLMSGVNFLLSAAYPVQRSVAPAEEKGGPYSYLKDPDTVGAGKNFTAAQKNKIYIENKKRNGGKLVSDVSDDPYQTLVQAQKSQKGVTPSQAECQVDHIKPKSKGGTNSYRNAQVTSRKYNRDKSDKE